MKQLVVMPGGFHPFHAGHAALYQSARQAFPAADVYVAATNDTSTRPFPFAVKEKLAKLAGVEPGHFVQVKSPFRAEEITQKFNPEDTQLIFVRSDKDANKPPQAGGVKKNGEPAYLQPYTQAATASMNQNAYMAYLPTVEFGPGMTSATEIRTAWPQLNEKRKTALVMSLYPKTQSNPKLAATVVKMLDTAIGTASVDEDISRRGFLRGMGAAAAAGAAGSALAAQPGNQQSNQSSDKPVTIAYVTIDGEVRQFNLGTRFNTSREALEFLDKVLADKGLSGYSIQLKRGYTNENQGWAATYEADGLTAGTGVTGGMHATYQDRYNQPIDERDITSKLGTKRDQGKSVRKWRKQRGLDEQDYLDENKVDPIEAAAVDFYQNKVGNVRPEPVKDYKEIARELLGKTEDPSMRKKIMDILVQGNKNPYIQGGIITTVAAIVSGGILTSAARMGLTPQQTNMMLQAVLNTVVPTVVSRLNGKSWSDTAKYTLASAGIGTGIAAMTETGRKK
jgi:hypothetical protein